MSISVQDVYYNVANMERALSFYSGVLGLPVEQRSEWWSSIDISGVRLGLHWTGGDPVPEVPGDEHGPHTGAQLTLRVSDLSAVMERMSQAGARILGAPRDRPWGKMIVCRDPDGNYLTLLQPKATQH
jgi:predicted enzyme related to lactoylglutathione lyase